MFWISKKEQEKIDRSIESVNKMLTEVTVAAIKNKEERKEDKRKIDELEANALDLEARLSLLTQNIMLVNDSVSDASINPDRMHELIKQSSIAVGYAISHGSEKFSHKVKKW